jgi:hypothetical protein
MDRQPHVDRVTATPAALAALARLREQRGTVILHQSSGCCPVYIDDRQFAVWKHTQLIIDVGAEEPEGFSLPAGDDQHFITSSRVFSPAELAALAEGG